MDEEVAYRRLVALLLAEFQPLEFVNFLRTCPGGQLLPQRLPAPSIPPSEFFHAAATVLVQDGIVAEMSFWITLRGAFRRKTRPIRETAMLFVGPLDPDARPVLEPTLSQWLAEHWRGLSWLFVIPAAVASLLLWAQDTGVADDTTGDRIYRICAYAWQAVFCALVVIVFSGWVKPGESSLFSPCDREQNLRAQLTSKHGPEDAEWAGALGLAPGDEGTLRPWWHAAMHARTQMRQAWIFLFLVWGLLSVGLLGFEIVLKDPGTYVEGLNTARSTLIRYLNDLSSVAFIACYWIMTFITVKFSDARASETRSDGTGPQFVVAGRVGATVATVVMIVHLFALLDPPNSRAHALVINFGLSFLSGIGTAVCTALLVGRLDSTIIGTRWTVLAMLYLYAAIQPCFSLVRLFSDVSDWGGAGSPLQPIWDSKNMQAVVERVNLGLQVYALFAKYLLFAVFAWIYHTGRLDFYFLRMRRLHSRISEDWQHLTSTSPREQPRKLSGPSTALGVKD